MTAGVLVAARLASSRLPNKALLEINGEPVLAHLLRRIQRAVRQQKVVLCTTEGREDDALIDVAHACGVATVRGSRTDILARYLLAAHAFDLDVLVTADGDDVFCDPEIIDMMLEYQADTSADYVKCVGLPYGTFPYVLTRNALERVCESKSEEHTEGWGRFFSTDYFDVHDFCIRDPELYRPEYRLTLDYPEDFQLLQTIFARLAPDGRYFSLREIFALLESEPGLLLINAHLREVYEIHFQQYRPCIPLNDLTTSKVLDQSQSNIGLKGGTL